MNRIHATARFPSIPSPACFLAVIEADAGSLEWFRSQIWRACGDSDRRHLSRILRRARSYTKDAARAARSWAFWIGYPVRYTDAATGG